MTPSPALPVEVARGIMLLWVLHVHAVYALLEHRPDADFALAGWLQIKVLAPHVVIFFALAGMTGKALADKAFAVVARRLLTLMLVAIASHVVGVLIEHALWKPCRPRC